jgi:hypothetical protein
MGGRQQNVHLGIEAAMKIKIQITVESDESPGLRKVR